MISPVLPVVICRCFPFLRAPLTLFFCVLDISSSISLIFEAVVAMMGKVRGCKSDVCMGMQ